MTIAFIIAGVLLAIAVTGIAVGLLSNPYSTMEFLGIVMAVFGAGLFVLALIAAIVLGLLGIGVR